MTSSRILGFFGRNFGEGLNKIPISLCDVPANFGNIALTTLKIVGDTRSWSHYSQQSKV